MMAYARKANPQGAEHWFYVMEERGIPLDAQAYGAVVVAHSKARNLDGAKDWLNRFLDAGHQPDLRLYTPLVDACAKAGDREGVLEMLQHIVDAGLKADGALYNAASLLVEGHTIAAKLGVQQHILESMAASSGTR